MTLAISLEEVGLRFGGVDVLKGLTLSIAAGETVTLVGPSGSGKSTTIRVMLGLVTPHRGIVRLGSRLASEPGQILILPENRDLAVVFQDLALWPHLTVANNLGFGLEARKVPRAVRRDRVHDMLERVGLAGKANRHPGELSGGERQRVAIARAMVLRPRAVLLDEPLTNLDVVLRADLFALLRSLLADSGAAALYVTHDLPEALALDTRIAVLEQGHIVADGLPGQLADAPATPFIQALFSEGKMDLVPPVEP